MKKMNPNVKIFNLSPDKQEILNLSERASFKQHCRHIGCDPEELEIELFLYYLKYHEDILARISQAGTTDEIALAKRFLHPVLDMQSYWEILHWESEQNRHFLVKEILNASKGLPINYAYLSVLSSSMGLPETSLRDPDNLATLLLEIPILNKFDLQFNAYVSDRSILGEIPCVHIYTLLPDAILYFVNILLAGLADPESKEGLSKIATDEQIELRGREATFMKSCMDGFSILIGKSTGVHVPKSNLFSSTHQKMFAEHGAVVEGSLYFVGLHEYGHLLLGHFNSSHTKNMEHEADIFATQVISTNTKNVDILVWKTVGIAILFNVLEMIEALRPANSSTHPTSDERLDALAKELGGIKLKMIADKLRCLWRPAKDCWMNEKSV